MDVNEDEQMGPGLDRAVNAMENLSGKKEDETKETYKSYKYVPGQSSQRHIGIFIPQFPSNTSSRKQIKALQTLLICRPSGRNTGR